MAAVEELSLEETNKIRISLGLKPLTDDKAPSADKEKEAEQNYTRVREQAAKERADRCVLVLLCSPCLDMRTDATVHYGCRALRDKIAK
jgi:HIND motif